MKHREDLLKDSDRLKTALKSQVEEIKSKSAKYGKSALWISGGVLAVFALSKIISEDDSSDEDVTEENTKSKKPSFPGPKSESSKPNFLLTSIQEQAILFSLGLVAERLRSFLKEMNTKDDEEGTE